MKKKLLAILFIMLLQLPLFALAEESQDIVVGGFELAKMLNLLSGFVALVLFVLTMYAYRMKRNKRLFFVSVAFLIFAIKVILISMEIFFGDLAWVDPVASILDFAMLLSFFFGILKK